MTGGARLWVQVRPGARRTEVLGGGPDRLRVAVAAPPVGGAANRELLRFLAARVGPLPAPPRILRGARSRTKEVLFPGLAPAELERRVRPLV